MVERAAVNREVVGSSPTSGAILSMFTVYVLENAGGKFYIGHTDNMEVRLANHNRTDRIDGKFTRKNGPWRLVWSEPHDSRSSAVVRERQIKKMKSAKWIRETLLNGGVPTCRD
jgi:putative endonuclease